MFITQWFDPEPTFKGILFAKELASRGFEVEVIAGFPNYPGGTLYDGYRVKVIQKEIIDVFEIIWNDNIKGRRLNYESQNEFVMNKKKPTRFWTHIKRRKFKKGYQQNYRAWR